MTQHSLSCRLRSMLTRFACGQGGVAAIEFAVLLPFMSLLFLGGIEVSQGISANRMTVLTASTVANLVTQYSTISASQDMPDILNASAVVLTPYPVSNAVVTVTCITIDGSGNATVAWSKALNGSGRPVGQVITLPGGLDVPNTTVIYGETTYAYTPVFNFLPIGTLHLYSSVFMLPRLSSTITLTS
jgi:Flp pilus assembly protein TadG